MYLIIEFYIREYIMGLMFCEIFLESVYDIWICIVRGEIMKMVLFLVIRMYF